MSDSRRRTAALVLVPALAAALAGLAAPSATAAVRGGHHDHRAGPVAASWAPSTTGSTARFRGVDSVSRRVAWLAGWTTAGTPAVDTGTVLRTRDGGRSWQDVSPPDVTDLQFRDIEAFDSRHAVVMAAGVGPASRIFRTDDGGQTWTQTFAGSGDELFLDCMAFFDHRRGLAMSDPVDGKFLILATDDGGRTWAPQPRDGMPDALPDEFGFAASGTCITTSGRRDAWFASGSGASRVFHSRDGGRTWSAVATPIRHLVNNVTGGAGIFSLAFRDRLHGLAVGGDLGAQQTAEEAAALTADGGATWQLVPATTAPPGYRSGSAWVQDHRRHDAGTAVAVGPFGSDLSSDGGHTWAPIPVPAGQAVGSGYDAVDCAHDGTCWGSGPNGQAAQLVLHRGRPHHHTR